MRYNKISIIFALLTALGVLYAANIFFTKSVSDAIVDTPAKVSFMIIEPPKDKCENCFAGDSIIEMIDSAYNIKYKSTNIPYDSKFSRKYIETYDIKNLPAVVVSGDIANEKVVPAWNALSGEERNDHIVIENLLPYYDIESSEVKGIIDVTLLKDEKCKDCFDENKYVDILKRFGLTIGDTTVYDIASAEGSALVQTYAITKVPTVILSSDAGDYPNFASSWKEIGTVEQDGRFVFREVQKLNLEYKKL